MITPYQGETCKEIAGAFNDRIYSERSFMKRNSNLRNKANSQYIRVAGDVLIGSVVEQRIRFSKTCVNNSQNNRMGIHIRVTRPCLESYSESERTPGVTSSGQSFLMALRRLCRTRIPKRPIPVNTALPSDTPPHWHGYLQQHRASDFVFVSANVP